MVLAYETLSETHWNVSGVEPSFNPELYINVDNTLDKKLEALGSYKSQLKIIFKVNRSLSIISYV